MTAENVSSHPLQNAVFYETTFATPPANAAAWASGEGTTVDRIRVLESLDVEALVQEAVADTRMKAGFQDEDDPISGLRNSEPSGPVVILHGAEAETADTNQVAETGFMRLLEHLTCGLTRGTSAEVDTSPSSNTEFDVTGSAGVINPGIFYWYEDADGDGTCVPVRVLTKSTNTVTTDLDPDSGITVAAGDKLHGAVQAYIDEDGLTNHTDSAASTISMLVERFGHRWSAIGGVLQLTSIEFPRGDQPRLNLTGMFASMTAPGDNEVGAPSWSGTVQGAQGLPVGVKTKVHIQDVGSTTRNVLDVISGSVTWGFPRTRVPTITEANDNAQGTAGYSCEKVETLIELEVLVDTDWQDDWDTKQEKIVRIYQQAVPGKCWAVHASRAVLRRGPPTGESGQNGRMTLQFLCKPDNLAGASNTKRANSRIQIVI